MSGLDGLTQTFEANKLPILATAAAGVVGFALLQRRKAGGNTAAASQGVATAPSYSAGGQVTGAGGAYSSAATDAYDLLQPQLEALGNKLNSVPVSTPPAAPVASTLLHPSYNGSYVRFADGAVDEVESDGSLYWLSPSEHATAFASSGGNYSTSGLVDQLNVKSPTAGIYSTGANILDRQPKITPAPATN